MSDDAEARLEFAIERLSLLRSEWEAAGRPFVQVGSRGVEVEDPGTRCCGCRRYWSIGCPRGRVLVGWAGRRRLCRGFRLR